MNEVLLELNNLFSPNILEEKEMQLGKDNLLSEWGVDVSVLLQHQQENVSLLRLAQQYRQISRDSTRLSQDEMDLVVRMMAVNAPSSFDKEMLRK